MKEVRIPQDETKRQKKLASMRRAYGTAYVFFYIAIAVTFVSLLGLLVVALVFELRRLPLSTLFYILIGSFGGGVVLGAPLSVLLMRLSDSLALSLLDFIERIKGDACFSVGEDTFAEFGETSVTVGNDGKKVEVPYSDLRLFSVCSRRRPREQGEWSVLLEIPARYLAKRPEKNAPPVLVQTAAKERLFRVLEERKLNILGEKPSKDKGAFHREKKFVLPDKKKRKSAVFMLSFGGVLGVGGVLAAVLWNITIGAIGCAVALLLLIRGTQRFLVAKRSVDLYREGVYLHEETAAESMFLKWEEIERVTEEKSALRFWTAYGFFDFPAPEGAFEAIEKKRSEGEQS